MFTINTKTKTRRITLGLVGLFALGGAGLGAMSTPAHAVVIVPPGCGAWSGAAAPGNYVVDDHSGDGQALGTAQNPWVVPANQFTITVGTAFSDHIQGNTIDDIICGNGGQDELDGNLGNDELYGGAQGDDLIGDEGDDLASGGPGADDIYGDDGNGGLDVADTLQGGDGQDDIFGGDGFDVIKGGGGGSDFADGEAAGADCHGTENGPC